MATEHKCLRCDGRNLEAGKIRSTGLIWFQLARARTKFFTFQTNAVEIESKMCMDCGTIDFVGDICKAQSLLNK